MSRQDDDDIGLRDPQEDDEQWAMMDPPDRPLGVTDDGATDAGQWVDEPLADRLAREEPELTPDDIGLGDDDRVGLLADVDSESDVDLEKDLVAIEADPDDPIGLSAEEAAIHLTVEPPMGEPGDGYLD